MKFDKNFQIIKIKSIIKFPRQKNRKKIDLNQKFKNKRLEAFRYANRKSLPFLGFLRDIVKKLTKKVRESQKLLKFQNSFAQTSGNT